MAKQDFERVFPEDRMTKRERVEAALRHEPLDRAPLLEQMSYNPAVIAHYTGKAIEGFNYTLEDIGLVIRKTMDLAMPPRAPRGTERVTNPDGSVHQHDNWTTWRVKRAHETVEQARRAMEEAIEHVGALEVEPGAARREHRERMLGLQALLGETCILPFSTTTFCSGYDRFGLDLFTYLHVESPELFKQFMEVHTELEVRRVEAAADPALSPVVLIPEDFATKQGPIFSPDFLREYHYPYVERLTAAWHNAGVTVLYHSDGNYRSAIPDLMAAGVDGFYCLEINCGMDVVELKRTWPEMVWAGGVDGVDLMERGTPEAVYAEVRRHIAETRVLETGGMFVATSSEVNPLIPLENFQAMLEATGSLRA